jgi:hypothetical protein
MRLLLPVLFACLLVESAHAERNPLEARLIVDTGWFFMF